MRNPIRKAGICLVLTLLGLALLLFATSHGKQPGALLSVIAGVAGLFLAIVSSFAFMWTLFSALGYVRLLAGQNVIARWHVNPAEWERFRAFDALRATQDISLRNDFRVRKKTPPHGVDIIVGRGKLIADGAYHTLRRWSSPSLRAVNWAPAPVDPECLEFTVEYPRGRYGGMFNLTLRLPVPASARSEGVRVFEHYRSIAPASGGR